VQTQVRELGRKDTVASENGTLKVDKKLSHKFGNNFLIPQDLSKRAIKNIPQYNQ
jgi:hypothetical protein